MRIHRISSAILSLAAGTMPKGAVKGQGREALHAGLSRSTTAAAPDRSRFSDNATPTDSPPTRTDDTVLARGSGVDAAGGPSLPEERPAITGHGDQGVPASGRRSLSPMTASGFLSTIPATHRVSASLVARSAAQKAAFGTCGTAPTPETVKDIRKMIASGRSEGLSPADRKDLQHHIAGLTRQEADHLSAAEKVRIIDLVGYHSFETSCSDEVLPILGTTSGSRPELGPVGLEQDLERVQKVLIESFDAEGLMPKLQDWAVLTPNDKRAAVEQTTDLVCKAYTIQSPSKPEIDDRLDQPARFDPEKRSFKISSAVLDHKNSIQMVRAIAHELTHMFQYQLIDQLEGSDGMAKGPYRENALLLRASNDYVKYLISPQGADHEHPDYQNKLIWNERQAFHMGDGIAERLADQLGIHCSYDNGVLSFDRDALARQDQAADL